MYATLRASLPIALALYAQVACAQADRSPRCPEAVAILANGHREASARWAANVVGTCGQEGANAVARALAAAHRETDPGFLDFISAGARDLQDAAILDAALKLATSPTASISARLFGIRTIIYQLRDGIGLTLADLKATGPSRVARSCMGASVTPEARFVGSPITTDQRTLVLSQVNALARDSSQPEDVRAAASCVAPLTRR